MSDYFTHEYDRELMNMSSRSGVDPNSVVSDSGSY